MSPVEVPHRMWRSVRARLGGCRSPRSAAEISIAEVWRGAADAETIRDLGRRFPPSPSSQELNLWPTDYRRACIAEAEDLLDHRLCLFALHREPLGREIHWNRDPSTGITVALALASRIDYRDAAAAGDVKYLWELGRMQHLVRLAQAWRFSGDERFAREIVAQIGGFIRQCPYLRGIHWTSPMEAALRLISWTWAIHWISDWSRIQGAFVALLACSVRQHLQFIDSNYSLFSSANNHLIAEAAGAYIAASFWRRLKGSETWRIRAKRHLARECLRQNWPDGVNKEQAFGYQCFVWELLLLAGLVARFGDNDLPQAYWDRLERMAEFMAWVSDCQGNTPDVGDRDDGVALDFGQDRRRPVVTLLEIAASIWNRPDLRACAVPDARWATRWLLSGLSCGADVAPARSDVPATRSPAMFRATGASASPAPVKLVVPPTPAPSFPRGTRYFSYGGYCVFRHGVDAKGEALLVFDVGPLGWPATAVHGHADALSIVLNLAGEPVLVDPGTLSYQDTQRRRRDRSTGPHNTLSFGGESQAEYLNRFLWGRRPTVEALSLESLNGSEIAEAQVHWWSGAVHRRRIDWNAQSASLLVTDSWQGPEPPVIHFCLAPGLRAEGIPQGVIIEHDRFRLRLVNAQVSPKIQPASVSRKCYVDQETLGIVLNMPDPAGQTTTELSWTLL